MNLPDRYKGPESGQSVPLATDLALVPGAAPFDRIDLNSIMVLIRRRFWLIMRVVGLSLVLTVLITFNMPTRYTAIADVELRTLPPSSTSDQTAGQTADDPGGVRIDAVDTELQVIKSRALAANVYDQLKLGNDNGFMKDALAKSGPTAIARRMVLMDPGLKKGASDPRERRELAIDYMIAQTDATRIVTTAYAVHISYSDSDPFRAARIVNAYAGAYGSDQAQSKQSDNSLAIVSLKQRIDQLATQARNDYAREQEYRIANNLLSTNGTALTEQEVSTYNQQVALARAEAAHDRAASVTARQQLVEGQGSAGEVQADPLVATLRSQRATISAHLADLSSRFTDSYPDVIAARQQLRDVDTQINAEIRRTLDMLEARASASEQRLASLRNSQAAVNGTLSRNNSAMIALDDLHRRSQASQQTYDTYLDRYKNAVAKSGTGQADSRTISVARPPSFPSSPSWPLNLALGLLLGLVLGGVSAVLAETNFSGLTTGDDVEQRLGVTYLGGVPMLESIKPRAVSPLATIAEYPGGSFAEAMRGVLVTARQSSNSRNQVLAITSALPDEGKTTLTLCLATLAGMAGERVCVIDCDIVRSRLSKLYPKPDRGLREFLEEGFSADMPIPTDPAGHFSFISILGTFSEGKSLNEQGRFHRLLAKLRERYDLIVLDLPPVLPVADVREIASLADNAIVVARWRRTSEVAIRAALRLLPLRDLSHLGVVLNTIDMRKRMQVGGAETFYRQYSKYHQSEADWTKAS